MRRYTSIKLATLAGVMAASGLAQDLTGIWTTDKNETYYIQQVGNTILWAGMSPDSGRTYTNVYCGVRNGATVSGDWADVPRGIYRGQGSLTIDIVGSGTSAELRKRTASGGFGTSIWRRSSGAPGSAGVITPSFQKGLDGLTGVWKGSDKGIYYMRQVGNLVYWLGMSPDNGGTFTNVFRGVATNNWLSTNVSGTWADIPYGAGAGRGSIAFAISNVQSASGSTGRVINRTSETGGFGASTWWGDPNFAGPVYSPKLVPTLGSTPVVTILWVPRRLSIDKPGLYIPTPSELNNTLFGPRPSVNDWFVENSGGNFRLTSAGILGPYTSDKDWTHYWNETPETDPNDQDGDGWVTGHIEKWAEAIRKASIEFDFSRFDRNGNKIIDPDELAVLIVIPSDSRGGYTRWTLGREKPRQDLIVNGVRVPQISEWYAGPRLEFGLAAHELCHQTFNAPDMYFTTLWKWAAAGYSIMDQDYRGGHLDPFNKLKTGWISYGVISESGDYALRDIETGHQALIVYDKRRGPKEYFLIENRYKGASYDAGFNKVPPGIVSSGLAIWHIIEDPVLFDTVKAPDSGQGEWGRRGIRLIRFNGGDPVDDGSALFSNGALVSDDTKPAVLKWLDGSRTGISIQAASIAGPTMTVRVTLQ